MWSGQVCGSREVWIAILVFGSALNLEVTGIATGHKAFPSLGNYASHVANTTNATTLQNQILARYNTPNAVDAAIKQPKGDDSLISGTSHRRGFLPQEHPGYDGHEFDEVPHYGYNFAHAPAHIDGHTYEPHADFHNEYSLGHYHHKLYSPALTAKALLLPVAGLALLGAAAALVTNPVFLQLGVTTGRRRRDTAAISNTHDNHRDDDIVEQLEDLARTEQDSREGSLEPLKRTLRIKINNRAKRHSAKIYPIQLLSIQGVTRKSQNYDSFSKVGKLVFVPIPLKSKEHLPQA